MCWVGASQLGEGLRRERWREGGRDGQEHGIVVLLWVVEALCGEFLLEL